MLARGCLAALFAALIVIVAPALVWHGLSVEAQATAGQLLAPAGGQAAWLDLQAPRPRMLTQLRPPAYVAEIAAAPGSPRAALVVVSPFGGQGTPGGDIVSLDLRSGALAPLVPRSAETESLTGPMWLPDGTTLVFQREDLSVVGESYAGMSRPVYPSRIELARTDTGRSVVIGSGRQPAPAPDGSGLVFVRTTREGTAMLVRSPLDGEEQVLIPQGTYLDIASPRYAPQGDRIAFMVPENPVSGSLVDQVGQLLGLEPVYAHGFPWDLWIMNKDATGVHRLAQLAADDGTVSWSPDGRELFVHGGTGSFLVDATSGDVTPLTFIAGYGTSTWLPDSDS